MQGRIGAGKKITLDGKSLEYALSGSGAPTLVLLSGHGAPLWSWEQLYPDIAQLGTVLAYDRWGVGGSDPPDAPQDGGAVIATLEALLGQLGLPPPYVLVAHSLGGLYANLYARRYPQKTAGLVLVEAGHADEALLEKDAKRGIAALLVKILDRLKPSIKDDPNSEYRAVGRTVEQIAAAGDFPPLPLVVVTGGKKMPLVPRRSFDLHLEKQAELAALSSQGEQVIAAKSGHCPQLSQPDVVLAAIRSVVGKVAGA